MEGDREVLSGSCREGEVACGFKDGVEIDECGWWFLVHWHGEWGVKVGRGDCAGSSYGMPGFSTSEGTMLIIVSFRLLILSCHLVLEVLQPSLQSLTVLLLTITVLLPTLVRDDSVVRFLRLGRNACIVCTCIHDRGHSGLVVTEHNRLLPKDDPVAEVSLEFYSKNGHLAELSYPRSLITTIPFFAQVGLGNGEEGIE